MEAVMYVIIGIMGVSILFSITGLIINHLIEKDDRKQQISIGK